MKTVLVAAATASAREGEFRLGLERQADLAWFYERGALTSEVERLHDQVAHPIDRYDDGRARSVGVIAKFYVRA